MTWLRALPPPDPDPGGAHASRGVRLVYVTRLAFTQWQFLHGQNAYLRERGFELHALAGDDGYLSPLRQRDGVVGHAIYVSPRAFAPVDDLWAVWRIYRELRRLRPDIVHLSAPKPAFLAAVSAWMARVPARVFLARGSATATSAEPLRSVWRVLERMTARLCSDVIVVSPSLRDFFYREGILPRGRGFVPALGSSNGVDARRFSPSPTPPPEAGLAVGYLGRLARGKGIESLAAAWARVREQVPEARLLLVGGWDDGHPVSWVCRMMLQSDPRVEIRGHVEDVVPHLGAMSVVVLPSAGEGLPNALLEAQAMEIPVVGYRVVGVVDAMVDGVTGTLVPPNDHVALADALIRYLGDDELRRRHGRAGRRHVVRCFPQEPVWEAVFARYQRLVRRPSDAPTAAEEGCRVTARWGSQT